MSERLPSKNNNIRKTLATGNLDKNNFYWKKHFKLVVVTYFELYYKP